MSDVAEQISSLIEQQQLPDSYWQLVQDYIQPLAKQVATEHDRLQKPIVVAINGGQGSGKSTLSLFLKLLLQAQSLKVVVLSQDDFYLGKAERQKLAESVHPLLATRGVPGTHNMSLALATLDHLLAGKPVKLPQFDKAQDDVVPEGEWPMQATTADIIVLEGWCVGAAPLPADSLKQPINTLEKNEDPEGVWRDYVQQSLAGPYQQWFEKIDYLVMLKVPGIASVFEWRRLQEEKLQAHVDAEQASAIMDAKAIERFVQHFERITRHQLETLPGQADVVLYLNKKHGIDSATGLEV